MTASIPISQEITVNAGVIGAGGNPLSLNAIFLTENNPTNPLVPAGELLQFTNAANVGAYFGLSSTEYQAAVIYFGGVKNGTRIPATLYFCKYATAARAAWIRGNTISAGSFASQLNYLQSLSGSLSVTIGGTVYTAASLNLSAATSIGGTESTSVINKMITALGISAVGTVLWDSLLSQFIVESTATGTGASVTFATGTIAAGLGLTAGILSAGCGIDTPATVMQNCITLSNDWAVFAPLFVPTSSDSLGFAAWAQAQSNRYWFILPDNSAGYLTANNSATLGAQIAALTYDSTIVAYCSANPWFLAAFFAAYAASINWFATNGRATLKFRQQDGLATYVTPITNSAAATAIISNNASYYGTYSAPGIGNVYSIVADGGMAGSQFLWADTFLGQLFLNSQMALAIFTGLLDVNSLPFGPIGDASLRAFLEDSIQQALNAGIIRKGITPSSQQAQEIELMIGFDVSAELTAHGFYLYLPPSTAQQRAIRVDNSPYLFYMDGGAIQKIQLNSFAVI